MNNIIHFPTEEENKSALKQFFTRQKRVNEPMLNAVKAAEPALDRLAKILCDRSGQCYKVRSLLYSIWNGKPAALIELVNLDWEIRQDVCSVLLAFGYEGNGVHFFYDAISNAVRKAGQWDWFLEERFEYKLLQEYADACRRAKEEVD